MKIAFFGDSLTKGQVSANFINLLNDRYPNSKLFNFGTNGATLNIISMKVLKHLQNQNDYDLIVLQGGSNDILLPHFNVRGGLFKFAYKSQIEKGHKPIIDSREYYHALIDFFRQIKALYKGKIIFITMGCLKEKIDTELNRERRNFNVAARNAAIEEDIAIADIEPVFENFLFGKNQTNYLIESFWAVTLFDKIWSLTKRGIAHLSERRKLHLTIDGVHLNNEGASIISNSIIDTLAKKVF